MIREPFCDNPKCRWHIKVPQKLGHLTLDGDVKYSHVYSPPQDEFKEQLTIPYQTRQRVKIVKIVASVTVEGRFCDVCAEAIKIVEGFE